MTEKSYSRFNNLATVFTPLIRNQWYVAGLASEFSRTLKQRYILGRSIVFYRTEDNQPVALQKPLCAPIFPVT